MTGRQSKFRAWAELGRVSNLPTVWSNCLVGAVLGAVGQVGILPVACAIVGCSLLYVAGMILNDWFDLEVDGRERPLRPLPSGRISPLAALGAGIALAVIANVVLAICGWLSLGMGLVLSAAIVIYNAIHQRFAAAAVVMGLCRGLVYLVAAACQGSVWRLEWPALTAGLVAYVTILTVIARGEMRSGPRHPRLALMALMIGVLAPLILSIGGLRLLQWVAGALLILWIGWSGADLMRTPARPIAAVLRLLAGICIVDALYLATVGGELLVPLSMGCLALTVRAHKRIPGT